MSPGSIATIYCCEGSMSCWTCAKISGAPVSKEQCCATQKYHAFVGICFVCNMPPITHQLFVHVLGEEWNRMLQHLCGDGLNMTSLVWHIGPAGKNENHLVLDIFSMCIHFSGIEILVYGFKTPRRWQRQFQWWWHCHWAFREGHLWKNCFRSPLPTSNWP